MTILYYLHSNLTQFSKGQHKIASYLIEHAEEISEDSSKQLAKKIGVSQSSIIKFIQRLNFSGFTQFKLTLMSEITKKKMNQNMANLHNLIHRDDSLEIIAQKLKQEKQQSLIKTTDNLCFVTVKKVIEQLLRARRIQLFGIGNSGLVVKDLAYKLQKLGLLAMSETDAHIQLAMTQSLTEKDIMLIISFSGKRKEIILAAEEAKKRGACLIALTSLQQSKLRSLSDFTLDTIADEMSSRSSSISSRTAQNCVTDLLFMGLVSEMGEKAENQIKSSSELIAQLIH